MCAAYIRTHDTVSLACACPRAPSLAITRCVTRRAPSARVIHAPVRVNAASRRAGGYRAFESDRAARFTRSELENDAGERKKSRGAGGGGPKVEPENPLDGDTGMLVEFAALAEPTGETRFVSHA